MDVYWKNPDVSRHMLGRWNNITQLVNVFRICMPNSQLAFKCDV